RHRGAAIPKPRHALPRPPLDRFLVQDGRDASGHPGRCLRTVQVRDFPHGPPGRGASAATRSVPLQALDLVSGELAFDLAREPRVRGRADHGAARDREQRFAQRRAPRWRNAFGGQTRDHLEHARRSVAGPPGLRVLAKLLLRRIRDEEAFELAATHTKAPAARASVVSAWPLEPSWRSRIFRATSARARNRRDLTVPSGSSSAWP